MSRSNGFTLFELMIVIAVIGIVSAIAVPAYNSYIETANMTKTTALFQEAIKNAQTTFTKDEARLALGLPVTAPVDTQGWVDYFAETAESAPAVVLRLSSLLTTQPAVAVIERRAQSGSDTRRQDQRKLEKMAVFGLPGRPGSNCGDQCTTSCANNVQEFHRRALR